jgi:hypothetical protein
MRHVTGHVSQTGTQDRTRVIWQIRRLIGSAGRVSQTVTQIRKKEKEGGDVVEVEEVERKEEDATFATVTTTAVEGLSQHVLSHRRTLHGIVYI